MATKKKAEDIELKKALYEGAGTVNEHVSKADVAEALGKSRSKPNTGKGSTRAEAVVTASKSQTLDVVLVGLSPLVVHAWDRKALNMMLAKHVLNEDPVQQAKEPFRDFMGSMYFDRDGRMGFPSRAIKAGMIEVLRYSDGWGSRTKKISKNNVLPVVRVDGEMCPLHGDPKVFVSPTKIGPWNERVATVGFRACYDEWAIPVRIVFKPGHVDLSLVVKMLVEMGDINGIGEMRPQKGYELGRFTVAAPDDAKEVLERLPRVHRDDITPESSKVAEFLEGSGGINELVRRTMAEKERQKDDRRGMLVDGGEA